MQIPLSFLTLAVLMVFTANVCLSENTRPIGLSVQTPSPRSCNFESTVDDNGNNYQREKNYAFAAKMCAWVAVCRYEGFEKGEKIGFRFPPKANFQVLKRLKGPDISEKIEVRYDFYDHGIVKAPDNWEFGVDKMPKPMSTWIIFLPNAIPIPGRGFDTFHGDFGRLEATPANIHNIETLIKSETK